MMDEYLDLMDYHSSYQTSLKRILSNQIDFTIEDSEEYEILRAALILRTQKDPNNIGYAEMLTWLFIQRQNFMAAFVHVKAIDKRTKSEGSMVYKLGLVCVENKDYTAARKSFEYIVDLGERSELYLRAYNSLLNVRFLEVTTQRNFTQEELRETLDQYDAALDKFGRRRTTFSLMMERAHILAFYANEGIEAIEQLEALIVIPGLTDMQLAEAKMALADIYVLLGDVWEASLLYMQIDKQFKYEPIGHEAKFKNARIFYYDGEFDYAQSQLSVLKRSTSKLIANDAINLSLLITDNYGLDSNYIAMNWFANADLLIEQHQYDAAFVLFDSIISEYPAHSLGDEIQLKKAYAMELQGKWNAAIVELEELLEFYSEDILADDALFKLGTIYENHLLNPSKAASYYRTILFDYKGSLYSEESRKRFQKLKDSLPKEGLMN
jgi:tetratricopeptide (TPR) repeat protein